MQLSPGEPLDSARSLLIYRFWIPFEDLPSPVYSSFFPLPCPLSGRTFWTISEGNLSWSLPPIVLYSREERVSKHRDDVWQVSRTSHLFNRRKMFLLSLRYARAISFSSRTCADMCPCTRCFLISKTASTVVVVVVEPYIRT